MFQVILEQFISLRLIKLLSGLFIYSFIPHSLSNQSSQKSGGFGISSYLPEAITDMWDTIPVRYFIIDCFLYKKKRSFATLKLSPGIENLCAISQNNTHVMVAAADGKFYEFNMDPKVGGELKLTHESQIIKHLKDEEVSIS